MTLQNAYSDYLTEQDIQSAMDCLASGWLTMGPRTTAFEHELRQYLGVKYALAVSSGTAALHLALCALQISKGDQVVLSGISSQAAYTAVIRVGAQPIFCDVQDNLAIDTKSLAKQLSDKRCKAVIVFHPLGNSSLSEEIHQLCSDHQIPIIEDCTEASLQVLRKQNRDCPDCSGIMACFDFAAGRPFTLGEGGALVSNATEQLMERAKLLRSHAMTSSTWDRHRGYADTYDVIDIGFNYRLDEIRSAIGISKLSNFDQKMIDLHQKVLDLQARLSKLDGCRVLWEGSRNGGKQAGVVLLCESRKRRDLTIAELRNEGIAAVHYPANAPLVLQSNHELPQAKSMVERMCVALTL